MVEGNNMAQIPMTDQEVKIALDALSDQIDKYAELLVKKGCAISEGSQLVINASIEIADFARRVQRAAMRLAQNLSQLFGAIKSPQGLCTKTLT